MNKKLAKALLKRNRATLRSLRAQIESGEVTEEELDDVVEEVETLQEEIEELVDVIETIEDDVETVEEETDVEETDEEARSKRRKRRSKRSRRKKISKREGDVEEIIAEVEEQLDAIDEELVALEEDIVEIEEGAVELEEELTQLEEERSKRSRRRNSKRSSGRSRRKTSRRKRNSKYATRAELEEEIAALEEEVADLEETVTDLEEEVEVLDEGVTDAEEMTEEELADEEMRKKKARALRAGRSSASKAIRSGLSTKHSMMFTRKEKEQRKAFANFVVGKISESEARALGIEAGNGSVTIPKVIASEIITYAQEENLLRKYGTTVQTKDTQGYPILVKKAEANVNKGERSTDITPTEIEFEEVVLAPAEFDALATVTKKLLARADVPVEDIVIDELKKAYVRKETAYMFKGDDVGHENPGALAKKAVEYQSDRDDDLYESLIKVKNTPATEVIKNARWIMNRAALTKIETMRTEDGFPLLRPFESPEGGIKHTLLGYEFDFTDDADAADPTIPVFYFGDFSQFYVQDVLGALEIQRLVEAYSAQNKVGFQIYNVVDGQLIYSPLAPAVYRYEVGNVKP